jgi:hypothetical protein
MERTGCRIGGYTVGGSIGIGTFGEYVSNHDYPRYLNVSIIISIIVITVVITIIITTITIITITI